MSPTPPNYTDRACQRCRERKPLTDEHFEFSTAGRQGRRSTCRPCRIEMRHLEQPCKCHEQSQGHKYDAKSMTCECGQSWVQQQDRAIACPLVTA